MNMHYPKSRNRDHIDLCSGIGGFALGFSWSDLDTTPKLFCDTEEWCRKVIAKNFPNVPIANDVKEIASDAKRFIQEKPFILSSGYPCQPFSVAGRRGGEEDPRHIYPYIQRIVEQVRPTWTVYENVYGHFSMGLDEVLFQMEAINYSTRTFVLPSSAIGARHKRDRVWIIGRDMGDPQHNGSSATEIGGSNEEVAERTQKGEEATKQFKGASRPEHSQTISDTESIRRGGGNGEQRGDQQRKILEEEQGRSSLGSEVEGCRESHGNFPDTKSERIQRLWSSWEQEPDTYGQSVIPMCQSERPPEAIWKVEPNVDRVVDGLPKRVDRIKGLGNSIVPQNAMMIANAIQRSINT
jgi:DNA (cytosine-5)-methyltransferase 1